MCDLRTSVLLDWRLQGQQKRAKDLQMEITKSRIRNEYMTGTRNHTYEHIHAHMHKHIHTHPRTYTHTHTHTHAHMH